MLCLQNGQPCTKQCGYPCPPKERTCEKFPACGCKQPGVYWRDCKPHEVQNETTN